jgi:hypothetical protein
MAEILNDLKLAALNIGGTSNGSPQATHSDSSKIVADTTTLKASESGIIVFSGQKAGANYTVTLPSTSELSLGARFTFVQTALLEAGEDLVIDTAATTEYFSTGSHALNSGGVAKPSNGVQNRFTVDGADTNCQHGIGSVIECQLVSSNKWLLQVPNPKVVGTGGAATYAFSAQ